MVIAESINLSYKIKNYHKMIISVLCFRVNLYEIKSYNNEHEQQSYVLPDNRKHSGDSESGNKQAFAAGRG